jgi:uncharacterized OsmC-like protein
MSAAMTHHVTVRLARQFEFVAEFDDVPGGPAILFDEPPPLGEGRAPNGAAVLAAAVGNCLAASLAYCLRRARLPFDGLTADVTAQVVRNEQGRLRIGGIDVTLSPELRPGSSAGLDRCEKLFEDFCTVTASVRLGIPINVSVRPAGAAEPAEPAAAGVREGRPS